MGKRPWILISRHAEASKANDCDERGPLMACLACDKKMRMEAIYPVTYHVANGTCTRLKLSLRWISYIASTDKRGNCAWSWHGSKLDGFQATSASFLDLSRVETFIFISSPTAFVRNAIRKASYSFFYNPKSRNILLTFWEFWEQRTKLFLVLIRRMEWDWADYSFSSRNFSFIAQRKTMDDSVACWIAR